MKVGKKLELDQFTMAMIITAIDHTMLMIFIINNDMFEQQD